MSKNVSHNSLKAPTPGGLTKSASYRGAVKAPNILEIANKSPDRAYRWLSKNMLDKHGGVDRRGWEILDSSNSKGEVMGSAWGITSTGSDLKVGDMVAAFMPIERQEIKRAALAEANNSIKRQFDSLRRQAVDAGAGFTGGFSSQRDGVTESFGNPIAG